MPSATRKGRVERVEHAVSSICSSAIDIILTVLRLPYFRVFESNTLIPIRCILSETDPSILATLVDRWILSRKAEVSYVQVAGAVLFTSVISCLSWTDLNGRHWSAASFWYCSIVLAISAVVLGAQQFVILEHLSLYDKVLVQQRLGVLIAGEWRPDRATLHVWQLPMMAFSYSIVFFFGGLMSYVVSPFAFNPAWDADAKTMVMFLTVTLAAAVAFVACSARIHGLLKDA